MSSSVNSRRSPIDVALLMRLLSQFVNATCSGDLEKRLLTNV